jgi:hypothetical protein
MRFHSLGVALLLVSCSSSPKTTSNNITPSGGTVRMSDGTTVNVPSGALTQTTQITVGDEPNSVSVNGAVLLGRVYRFGPEGTQFAVPVTVTLLYDPTKLPSGDSSGDVVIMTAPVGSTDFQPLTTTVADDTHVSATTTHFSDFVATAQSRNAGDDLSAAERLDLSQSDQGGANVDQLSSNADQSTPPDQASSCPKTWNVMSCTLSANAASCGGTFNLNCAQSICLCGPSSKTCTKPSPAPNNFGCPSEADELNVWTTCCMFP